MDEPSQFRPSEYFCAAAAVFGAGVVLFSTTSNTSVGGASLWICLTVATISLAVGLRHLPPPAPTQLGPPSGETPTATATHLAEARIRRFLLFVIGSGCYGMAWFVRFESVRLMSFFAIGSLVCFVLFLRNLHLSKRRSAGYAIIPSPPPFVITDQLPLGPSPEYWPTRQLRFSNWSCRLLGFPGAESTPSLTRIMDSQEQCVLMVGPGHYAQLRADTSALLWRSNQNEQDAAFRFDCVRLDQLAPLADPGAAANDLAAGRVTSPIIATPNALVTSLQPRHLADGVHAVECPDAFLPFGETLAVGDHRPDTPSTAIFVFDWAALTVTVLPQDWFNQGNYHLGQQWISAAGRLADGRLVVTGREIGHVYLDESGRNVDRTVNR